uniref:Uncharacterized protein n=1 Tax=Panagrolaimus sp. JU765 TaxID=591449 RepID=A0AC34PVY7_9BILA
MTDEQPSLGINLDDTFSSEEEVVIVNRRGKAADYRVLTEFETLNDVILHCRESKIK